MHDITVTYNVDPALLPSARRLSPSATGRVFIASSYVWCYGVGRLRQVGAGFEWVPLPYSNRLQTATDGVADPHKGGTKHGDLASIPANGDE